MTTKNKKQEAHLLSLMIEALCDKADALIAEAERKEGVLILVLMEYGL